MKTKILLFLFLLSFPFFCTAQNKEKKKQPIDTSKTVTKKVLKDSLNTTKKIDPLSPSRAAFYSAVIPGLGHVYTKQYWKVPVIYVALGTGIYFYIDNNTSYKRYRNAYKRRLAGFTDDEFYGSVSDEGLINAQETLNKNREISLLVTLGIYALNIIWANVDAHLMQYNVNNDLSLRPHYNFNPINQKNSDVGVTLNFTF